MKEPLYSCSQETMEAWNRESRRGNERWLDLECLLKAKMTGPLMDCRRQSRVGKAHREEFRLLPGLGP